MASARIPSEWHSEAGVTSARKVGWTQSGGRWTAWDGREECRLCPWPQPLPLLPRQWPLLPSTPRGHTISTSRGCWPYKRGKDSAEQAGGISGHRETGETRGTNTVSQQRAPWFTVPSYLLVVIKCDDKQTRVAARNWRGSATTLQPPGRHWWTGQPSLSWDLPSA